MPVSSPAHSLPLFPDFVTDERDVVEIGFPLSIVILRDSVRHSCAAPHN